MSKDTQYPCYRWDSEGIAHRCEGPQDVQPGWTDQHPANLVAAELSREEITAALADGGIEFSKNAPTAALHNKLVAAAQAALSAAGIPHNEDASARELLALLPKPE